MTNEELVKQFYDGDKTALHALYEQNTGFIHETVNFTSPTPSARPLPSPPSQPR